MDKNQQKEFFININNLGLEEAVFQVDLSDVSSEAREIIVGYLAARSKVIDLVEPVIEDLEEETLM